MLFIIGCIVFGLLLAVVLAPIIALQNANAIRQMRTILKAAEHIPKGDAGGYQRNVRQLLGSLYELKTKIVADQHSLTQADDIIDQFKYITQ